MLLTKIVKTFEGNYEEAMKIWNEFPFDSRYQMTVLGETFDYYREHPEYSTSWVIWTIEA